MSNKVLWVSGWACSWPKEFQQLVEDHFSGSEHHWLGYERQAGFDWDLSEYSHVIGWSLGAKRVVESLGNAAVKVDAEDSIPSFTFIAPAWDFCEAEFGWDSRVLKRMQKMLERAPENVLIDFYKLVGIPEALWTEQLEAFQPYKDRLDDLKTGLEELVSPVDWSTLSKTSNYQALSLSKDGLVKPELLEKLAKQGNFANLQTIEFESHFCAQESFLEHLNLG